MTLGELLATNVLPIQGSLVQVKFLPDEEDTPDPENQAVLESWGVRFGAVHGNVVAVALPEGWTCVAPGWLIDHTGRQRAIIWSDTTNDRLWLGLQRRFSVREQRLSDGSSCYHLCDGGREIEVLASIPPRPVEDDPMAISAWRSERHDSYSHAWQETCRRYPLATDNWAAYWDEVV
ncbi:MAG: hypothetical protein ACYCW6_22265 [Candidatus Xenobia bacterium]